jgi:hypothetical protein
MLSETLSQTNVINYPLFALILFVAVFAVVVVRVLMRGSKDPRMEAMRQLPLAADDTTRDPAHPRSR